jgi:hypothetical protein
MSENSVIIGLMSPNITRILWELFKTSPQYFLWGYFHDQHIKVQKIIPEEAGYSTILFEYPETMERKEAAHIVADFHKKCGIFESKLTEREIQIVDKIALKKSYYQIGLEMGQIRPSSVAGFVKRIRDKLQAEFPTVKKQIVTEEG